MDSAFLMTSKQAVFVMYGSTVATGVLSLPRAIAEKAYQDAWLSVIIGVLMPLLSLALINQLGKKFPNGDFARLNRQLLGPYLCWLIVIIFTVYVIFYNGVIIRIFAEITSLYMLQRTPMWAVMLVSMAAVFYAASYGAKIVGRLNELLFYILFSAQLIGLFSLRLFQGTNLLPVGETGIKAILNGSLVTAYAYGGIEVMLIMVFMVQKRGEFVRAGLISTGLVLFTYLWWVIAAVGIFGPYAIQESVYPVLTLFKASEAAFLERVEIVFLIVWVGLGARPVINWTTGSAYFLVQALGLDIKKYYKLLLGFICLAIFAAAMIPHDINQVFQFGTYVGYGVLAAAIGLPLFYNVICLIRRTA